MRGVSYMCHCVAVDGKCFCCRSDSSMTSCFKLTHLLYFIRVRSMIKLSNLDSQVKYILQSVCEIFDMRCGLLIESAYCFPEIDDSVCTNYCTMYAYTVMQSQQIPSSVIQSLNELHYFNFDNTVYSMHRFNEC